jgi:cold shock CspA family protein
MQGTIKKVMTDKGYGFIENEEDAEKDIFFHSSGVTGDFYALQIGTKVTYDLEDTDRGSQAVNVAIVE